MNKQAFIDGYMSKEALDADTFMPPTADPSPQTDVNVKAVEGMAKEKTVEDATAMSIDKEAGNTSEMIGRHFNPATILGSAAGAAAGGTTKTLNAEEFKQMNDESWKNILIPGRAGYNQAKRLGYMRDLAKRLQSEDPDISAAAHEEAQNLPAGT